VSKNGSGGDNSGGSCVVVLVCRKGLGMYCGFVLILARVPALVS